MASSTSTLLHHISAFRNPEANATSYNCGYVALAQLGYMITIPYAIIEAAISHIAKAVAYCAKINQERYQKISAWADSSAIALLWTAHCVAINFFVVQMSPNETAFSQFVLKKEPQPDLLLEDEEPNPVEPEPPIIDEPIPWVDPYKLRIIPDPKPNPLKPGNPNLDIRPEPVRPINPKPFPDRRAFFQEANDDALDDDAFQQLLAMNALHEDKPPAQKPVDTPADQEGQKPDPAVKPRPVNDQPPQESPPPEIELPPQPVLPSKPIIKLDRIKSPAVNELINLRYVESSNVQKLMNSYKVLPIKIVDDENPQNITTIDAAKMLKNYELGDSAVSYTEIYDRICRELDSPSNEEITVLMVDLYNLCEDSIKADMHGYPKHRFYIKDTLEAILLEKVRSPENDRFVKMLASAYKTVIASNDESEIEIMRCCLAEANQACRVRQNDEVQRLFIKYVGPRYNFNISSEDCLVFEFMQHRTKLRENLLNILGFTNTHERNFYSKELYNFFYLPPPSISIDEYVLDDYRRREALRIKKAFRQCYDSPQTIYTIFLGLLHPKAGEKFNYKAGMFIDWLETNKLTGNAFADDMSTIYKPELIIRYLVETGFLKQKQPAPQPNPMFTPFHEALR